MVFLFCFFLEKIVFDVQCHIRVSQVAQCKKSTCRCSNMQEMWVRSLGREDPLEEEMAVHSSTLAWRIPQTEEPGGPQSMGSQRVRHGCATERAHSRCQRNLSVSTEAGLPQTDRQSPGD